MIQADSMETFSVDLHIVAGKYRRKPYWEDRPRVYVDRNTTTLFNQLLHISASLLQAKISVRRKLKRLYKRRLKN